MTSEKKIRANRLNGLKGGVKTPEGKAVSRLNAVTHGILSKDIVLPGEDPELLKQLRVKIKEELKPEGEMEEIMVEGLVSTLWRWRRAIRLERKYTRIYPTEISSTPDFVAGGDYRFGSWQNYLRYITTLRNDFYRTLHEIQRTQKARLARTTPPTFPSLRA